VHGRGQQQRRDRGELPGRVAVAEHDDLRALVDGFVDLSAQLVKASLEALCALIELVQPVDHLRRIARRLAGTVDAYQLGQLVRVEDREVDHDLPAAVRARVEQVPLRPDRAREARHELLTDRVERRIGDLGEQLAEVVEQRARVVAQDGKRRVVAHRANGLRTGVRHRRDDDPQLLVVVAEDLLAARHGRMAVNDVLTLGEVGEVDMSGRDPLGVRLRAREFGLDLLVVDDPVLLQVDEEDPTGP